MSGSLTKFIRRLNPTQSESPMLLKEDQPESTSSVANPAPIDSVVTSLEDQRESTSRVANPAPMDFIALHDLGLISTVDDSARCSVARLDSEWFRNSTGPFAQKCRSGQDPKGATRSLSRDWFTINLPNGEKVERSWMCYSPSKKALLCLPCVLFSIDSTSKFSRDGFQQWWKLNPKVSEHERSSKHLLCSIQHKELINRLAENKTLDNNNQEHILLMEKKLSLIHI